MKLLLFAIFLVSALCWSGFGYIIWTVPPTIDGELVLTNFVYALMLGTIGLFTTLTILVYFVSSLFRPKGRLVEAQTSNKKIFLVSLRRSALISVLFSGVIALKVLELLNILNVALLVGILILIEIYFSSR